MARRACESCDEPMSDVALLCPHCGAQQSRRPSAAAVEASAARPRSPEANEQAAGLFGAFFRLDPRLGSGARLLEALLVALALPALLLATFSLVWLWLRLKLASAFGGDDSVPPIVMLKVIFYLLALMGLYPLSMALLDDTAASLTIVVVEAIAIGAREALRASGG
jgi:hypothetical protein